MLSFVPALVALSLTAQAAPAPFESCDDLTDHVRLWRGARVATAVTPFLGALEVEPISAVDASVAVTAVAGVDELREAHTDGERVWALVDGGLRVAWPAEGRSEQVALPGRAVGLLPADNGVWVVQQVSSTSARELGLAGSGVAWTEVAVSGDTLVVKHTGGAEGTLVDARHTDDRLVVVTKTDLRSRAGARSLTASSGRGLSCDAVWRDDAALDVSPVVHTVWSVQHDDVRAAAWLGAIDHVSVSQEHAWLVAQGVSGSEVTGISLQAPTVTASAHTDAWVLHRSAISEHNGVLRLAGWWPAGHSGVVTLDAHTLQEKGRLTGLAPREDLTGTTIVGDRAYLWTWLVNKGDPLYVVDLSEPSQPQVLGELQIPGRSDAASVLVEDRVVTVGQQRVDGRTHATVSVFDVSDPTAPRLGDVVMLEGARSEATDDVSAWVWSPATQTLLVESGRLGSGTLHGLRLVDDHWAPVGVWSSSGVRSVVWLDGAPLAVTSSGLLRGTATGWEPVVSWGGEG